jgi:hypothetical protein
MTCKMIWKTSLLAILLVFSAQSVVALPSSDDLDADIGNDPPPTRPIPPPAKPPTVAPARSDASSITSSPKERVPSANPLWAIPLSQLSGTRDRPIFSVSRRPPASAVAASSAIAKAPPPPPKVPERPQLSLVGTIASGEEGFGIFLDQATKAALRLKVGEDHQGWKLQSIRGREVTLEKDRQTAVLSLPSPSGEGSAHPAALPVLFNSQRE